jgi:inorganic pyrophosphatase
MHIVDITIETPKGSAEKFTYDPERKCFMLKKVLPAGMSFPYDFGFIPQSMGEDGDPLDALVISEHKTFPGCVVECRLIGALLAEQLTGKKKIRNDRYFFVPQVSVVYGKTKLLTDLPKRHITQLVDFFVTYNKAEGKQFRYLGVVNADKAYKLLKKQANVESDD